MVNLIIYKFPIFQISNILLIVNSSANFVYYCLVAESFRKQISNLFMKYCKCLRQYFPYQQTSQTSPYPKMQLNEMYNLPNTQKSLIDDVVNQENIEEENPILQVIVQAEAQPEPKNIWI